MQPQITVFPLFRGLEHQRQRHHIGTVQLFQTVDRLRVILAGGATHEGKSSQRHHHIDNRLLILARVGNVAPEVAVHGLGKVQSARKHGDHPRPTGLNFLHQGDIVGIIPGDQVGALQNQTHTGSQGIFQILVHIPPRTIPVEVFLHVLKHLRCQGMPNPHVGIGDGIVVAEGGMAVIASGFAIARQHVLIRQHQQEVFQVLRRTTQPVLEAEHEVAGILRLINRQVLQHRRQGA